MKVIRLILPVLLLAGAGFAQEVWYKYSPTRTFRTTRRTSGSPSKAPIGWMRSRTNNSKLPSMPS